MELREETTRLLIGGRRGEREALDVLFPIVYRELRRRAHWYLKSERSDHTLSTTDLVHEAYLKLVDVERVEWQDRAHFLAVAARAMRRILVDYARRYRAAKRGGGRRPRPLEDVPALSHARSEQMRALDEALDRLGRINERLARTIELRYFGGLTFDETARVLGVAPSTTKLDWQKAKAWLYRRLREESERAR